MSDDLLFHPLPPVDAATWRRQVERELGTEASSLATDLVGGLTAAPIYFDRDDADGGTTAAGLPPARRGGRVAGGEDAWRITQIYGQARPEAARAALIRDLDLGLRVAWLRFDLGGQGGQGGQGGIAISTVGDVEALLSVLTPADHGLIVDGGPDGLAVAALAVKALGNLGHEPRTLALAIDPLASLARDGLLPGSLDDSWRQLEVVASWADEGTRSWRTAGVSTVPYHDGGAHPGQELAFALATGVEYLRVLTAQGRSVAEASARIFFTYAVGRDLFLEIAKLRAARWLWAKVIRAAGGDGKARRTRLVACTSATTKSRRGPWINQLRLTTETFAAVVGGADDIVTAAFDQALGSVDPRGGRLAVNTQHILAEEAHLGRVADPAGGSGYVEDLTEQLARQAWDRFRAIERQGGMAACLRSGAIAEELTARADEQRAAVACRRDPFIGVSAFALLDEQSEQRPRPEVTAVTVPAAAAVVGGPEARARRIEGVRWAAPFELLHDAADRATIARGTRPACLLVRLGAARVHQPQAAFARRALAAGGIQSLDAPGTLETLDAESLDRWSRAVLDHARAELDRFPAIASEGTLPPAVVCPGDLDVATALPAVIAALRAAGLLSIIVVGPTAVADDSLRDGCDLLAFLARLHATLEIDP